MATLAFWLVTDSHGQRRQGLGMPSVTFIDEEPRTAAERAGSPIELPADGLGNRVGYGWDSRRAQSRRARITPATAALVTVRVSLRHQRELLGRSSGSLSFLSLACMSAFSLILASFVSWIAKLCEWAKQAMRPVVMQRLLARDEDVYAG